MNKIWKILKIIFIVTICLFVVGLIAVFIFLKNFDIKKYKPQMISAVEQAVGRNVNFDDIGLRVSLSEGIRFNLKNLTISENSDFGLENFLKVSDVSIGVDILSFINSRQISVPNIFIRSPQITIIRQASGKLNIETIGASSQTSTQSVQSSSVPAASALPAIFINSLRIEDAQLKFVDQSTSPNLEVSVSQLNLGVDHFSLISPFSFFVEAAILSPQKNFKVDGNIQLNLRTNEARLNNVRVVSDLGQLSLDEIRRFPMLKGVPIPQVLEGQFSGMIKECVVSDKGLGTLLLDTKLNGGHVVINELGPGISVDLSHIDLSVSDFSFDHPFRVALKAGYLSDIPNIDFQGTVAMDMKTQGIRLSSSTFLTDLSYWPLDKMKANLAPLKDVPLPEKIAGQVQVTIKDLAAGPKGLDTILLDSQWQNGEVLLEKAVPGVSVHLSETNVAVENFSLNAPFKFSLHTALLNNHENIAAEGTLKFDQKTQAVDLNDTKIAVDLDALSLEKLKASVLALKDIPLPQTLGGKLTATLKNLSAGPKGLMSVLADVNLNQGKVAMKDAAPGISFDAEQIDLAVKDFSLTDPFEVNAKVAYLANTQNIFFDGTVAYNMQTQDLRLKKSVLSVDLAKLDLDELKSSVISLKDVPLPQKLSGDLSVHLNNFAVGPKGLGTVLIDADIKNGALSMKDVSPGISVDASLINLNLTGFSLGNPFEFRLKAAYLGDQSNIDLGGTAALDLVNQTVQLKDTTFKADLSKFSIDALRASVASLKTAVLPQSMKGQLNVVVNEATAGAKGLLSLKTQGELSQGAMSMKELLVPIDAIELKFHADQMNADIDGLSFAIGRGIVKTKVAIEDYLVKQSFNAQLEVKDIDIAQIIEQKDAPVKIAGVAYADLKAQGQGSDLKSIVGDGTIQVKNAQLKDLNVLKLVLDKLALVPNLSEKVKESLPEKYIQKLENKDTDINKVEAALAIAGGNINVNPIDVQADEFIFEGQCLADFDPKYSLTGAFMIPQELAASMVKGVKELQYFLDAQGNIRFPLKVEGKGSAVPTFTPDMGDIMKNAAINKGKEELGKALGKIFTKGDAQSAPDSTSPKQGDQKSPEQQIVDSIFGTIFK